MPVESETKNQTKDKAGAIPDMTPNPEVAFFSIKAQQLDKGNTEVPLAMTDKLWLKIKVYAEGGENQLHAHPYQDHSFIVLQGRARFYGPEGESRECGANEGIMLPAGAFYYFCNITDQPLVLLRIGATIDDDKHPDMRIMNGDEWNIRRGRGATYISPDVVYREGEYFGKD